MSPFTTEKFRLSMLLGIMATVVIFGVSSTLYVLYQHMIEREKSRFSAIAVSQVRIINTLYRTASQDRCDPVSRERIIDLLKYAYQDWYRGLGSTGEIVLAHRKGEQIEYLFKQRHAHKEEEATETVPWQDHSRAVPMRRALGNESGVIIDRDYRGTEVLAAYEYIEPLGLGMVIKIDLDELRSPLLEAISKTVVLTLLLLCAGGVLFIRVGDGVIRRLHDSQETLHTIFEATEDGIALLATDSRALHMANSRFCRMAGCQLEEVGAFQIGSMDPDGELLSCFWELQHHQQASPLSRSGVRLFSGDGSPLYADLFLSFVVVRGQKHFLLMLRDVTERHRIRATRMVNEERINLMMVINRRLAELSVQELYDGLLDAAEKITRSRNGLLYLFDDDQNSTDTCSLVSWNRHPEQGCNLHHQSCEFLDHAEVNGVVIRQRQPVVCNDYSACCTQCGLPDRHWPVTRFLSVPVLVQDKLKLVMVVANKQDPYDQEDVQQLRILGDDVMNCILRKRLEEALRRSKEQAEASNRAKAQFLASMSHEIRTPMNGVLGMADLILRTSLTEKQRHYVNTIHRSGRTLLRIINDILDLSRIQSGHLFLELIRFDLDELIQDLCPMFTSQTQGKGLDFVCSIADNVPLHLLGDPYRLNQILFNLIGNAIKFTEKGSVALVVDVMEEREADVLCRFQVIDTGIGIVPEYMPNLFQPFSQADSSIARKFGGSGLGLAIARQLVGAMDGELWVKSHPGQGTTFAFTARFGKQRTGDREVLSQWANSQQHVLLEETHFDGHVLLVEDNLVNQEVAEATLKLFGLQVTVASNGQQALLAVQNGSISFDAIFMDCEMPILDGFETTKRLRAWEKQTGLPRVPIIALTAHVLQESRQLSRDVEMDDYLHKPFSQFDLVKVLRRWLPSDSNTDLSPIEAFRDSTQESLSTVLDWETLEQITVLARKGGGALLEKMVGHFGMQTPKLLTELGQSLGRGDTEGVRVAAHTLKSSSLTIGAVRLAELASAMEVGCTDLGLVAERLQLADPEFEQVKQALNDFVRAQAEGHGS
ncbi:MAG: response regulator [Magnetococcales bacterium]|nr:response regulator [Magnetococcales bacterium]